MVATNSTMQALGSVAPDFTLPAAGDGTVSLTDFSDAKALLVMFVCNHCPFVKHVADEMGRIGRDYAKRGLATVAINANDWDLFTDDQPERMPDMARLHGWSFPYLYDASQDVAKAYRAACTPDFFLYDAARKLIYRGQLDASRPGNDLKVTGGDLRAAIEDTLAGRVPSDDQRPSIGCNIKWKPGNEPDYFRSA